MQKLKNTDKFSNIVIRKSLGLFIFRVILLELFFEAIYLSWRLIIHLLPLPIESLITLNSISIALFLFFITIIQNILLINLALNWVNNYYEFREKDIAHHSGVLSKKKQSYQYQDIQSITINQEILGRILNYGSITLYIPTLDQDVEFNEVTDPKSFVSYLKEIKPVIEGARYIVKR